MSDPIPAKSRHGCLTAYLVFLIVAHSACTLAYLFAGAMMSAIPTSRPAWITWTLILIGIFNVVCSVALFRFKRWGFWGYVGSSILTAIVNLAAGVPIIAILLGLSGVAVLYGVLQIGKADKGWPQLD